MKAQVLTVYRRVGFCSLSELRKIMIFRKCCKTLNFCSPPEYPLVDKPPWEFYCPVTFGLLVRPQCTSCCRQPLSELAVVKIKEERGKCPLCRASQWETKIDKKFQRKVQALDVFCAHVDRGCQWRGKVREFDNHIASCPMKNAPLKQKQTGYIYLSDKVG